MNYSIDTPLTVLVQHASSFNLIGCLRIGKQAEKQPEQTTHSLKKRIPSTEWKCFTSPYNEA